MEVKVIYCVSELEDWVYVAKYFQQTKGWEPTLWLTTRANKDLVSKELPSCDRIDFYKANRGVFDEINFTKQTTLDKELLLKYLVYEKNALKMMDRMDADTNAFLYNERVHLYHLILEFIVNYFKVYQPQLVFFNESPHSIFTYLTYAVARENGIKILRLSPTHINGNTFLTTYLGKYDLYRQDVYNQISKDKKVSSEVEEYIQSINGKYDNATPYYMNTIVSANAKPSLYKIYKSFFRFIKLLFKKKRKENYYKLQQKSIREYFNNKDLAFAYFRGTFYKIRLEKEYKKYVAKTKNDFDFEQKYIYFPLQYQPEKSTSPEGDFFAEQFLALQMLSFFSQKYNFKIFIKEHISQFSPKLQGEQGRLISFYKEVSLLENVVFVDTGISSFSLIDKAFATATITGTAGMESVIRQKSSIIFGYPWYKECHGVYHIQTVDGLEKVLNILENGIALDIEKVKYFVESIFQVSEKIYLNNSNKRGVSTQKEDNKSLIIKLIERYESKIDG